MTQDAGRALEDDGGPASPRSRRYGWQTPEFGRVVNLSDAVFAIALTLLVLSLEVPQVPAEELAGALRDQVPQLVTFGLAFLLIANIWWQHHRLFAVLGSIEPGMIAINIVALAGIALAPYPTALVGATPRARPAVLAFIGLFLVLSLLWVVLILRAAAVDAWRHRMRPEVFRWLLADWAASVGAVVLALLVALVSPVAGLAVLAVASTVVGLGMSRFGPPERTAWF